MTQCCGWLRRDGGREEIRPGDVVGFERSERRWLGATSRTGMIQIAIQ